ncbi:hypothetical protein L345_15060, partial [Ophiophagus hannah]
MGWEVRKNEKGRKERKTSKGVRQKGRGEKKKGCFAAPEILLDVDLALESPGAGGSPWHAARLSSQGCWELLKGGSLEMSPVYLLNSPNRCSQLVSSLAWQALLDGPSHSTVFLISPPRGAVGALDFLAHQLNAFKSPGFQPRWRNETGGSRVSVPFFLLPSHPRSHWGYLPFLLRQVCKGASQHEEVCLGLFTMILTEPAQAQKCYRDLALVSRDGLSTILTKMNQILMEKYLKLQDTCRTQLVWLLREMVRNGIIGIDGNCMTFMKQIAGGCPEGERMLEFVPKFRHTEREWVLKSALLIAMSVYTYLRLIVDHHGSPSLQALRQKEVDFCVSLLRDRVRLGQQKRYQDWFQRQYLSTPDSQSLRCDLIRYICGVVHPSNESNVAASNAKLALFYDWLFFNPDKDSIMNI